MKTKRALHIVKKCAIWTILSLIVLVLIAPALLYIPFVQDFAKNIAVKELSRSTGMEISLDRLRLKFPLRLSLDNLSAIQQGDTLLSARTADVDVRLLPLFKGQIDVTGADLEDAFYRLNNADSAIYLTAAIEHFSTKSTDLGFDMKRIDVGPTLLDGADITLILKDTVTTTEPDTTASKPMLINAPQIEMRRVRFKMKMLPTIDSLNVFIGSARLTNGVLDMGSKAVNTINVGSLDIDSIDATYLTPSPEFLANYHSPKAADTTAVAETSSTPWVINAGSINLTGQKALYATAGAVPQPGPDMNYLQVSDIKISVDSFYNCGTSIRVPLKQLQATERCGLSISGSGTFAMDSTRMTADDFIVSIGGSQLSLSAMLGMGDMMKDPSLPLMLNANGSVNLSDVYKAMPSLSAMMKGIPSRENIQLTADINGTMGSMNIDKLKVSLPGYLSVGADGHIDNPTDFNRMSGRVNIDGDIRNAEFLKAKFLDAATSRTINIPPMKINGSVNYNPGLIDGNVDVASEGGKMALKAKWNQRAQGYDLNLDAHRFPIQRFVPGLGISNLTATAKVKGHGYDPTRRSTAIDADIDLAHLSINGQSLDNISLKAQLDTCRLTGHINSDNTMADMDADITAWLTPSGYDWDLSGDVRSLDLKDLGLSKEEMNGGAEIYTSGNFNPRNGNIDAELSINNLDWIMGEDRINVAEATARLLTTDSLVEAHATTGDFHLDAKAYCSLDTLLKKIDGAGALVQTFIDRKNVDVVALQQALPQLDIELNTGHDNALTRYLSESSDISFKSADLCLLNDSLISMKGNVTGFVTGSTRLDSINIDMQQKGRYLLYNIAVENQPGTMDDFAHIDLSGYVSADKLSAFAKQANIKGENGFNIGVNATMSDSTVMVKFVPQRPTIAYKKWTLNDDNYVVYGFDTKHFDANLKLSSDSSSLHVYTEHPADSSADNQEDIIVKLNNILLSEWLSISPFAPPIKGAVNADLRFRLDKDQITGKGTASVNNLYYGRERVGTFDLDLDVANDPRSKALRADIGLMVDGVKVMTATGNLNDSTAVHPFLLDFSMIHFPLRVVNPFLPKDVAQLSGMLNGKMDITGDPANPIFNGYIDFDSTAVTLGMTGASYAFSEEKVPVDSNIVRFNNFSIAGLNGNDLHINGTVDARKLTNIGLDLQLTARDMQLVNSSRPHGASVYGKAFVDLDAMVKGNMQYIDVDASVDILSGTNVTYVVQDAQSTLTTQSKNDMVRFVQFSDTAQVAEADSIVNSSMAMNITANLTISTGSTINVDLSTDGKNKASINANGNLTYTQTPMSSEGRLTGRLNITDGFVRYTPPFMSEKNFKFQEGCYVTFTGDIMNPTLYIKAVDKLKANVTQEGQNSRLINFDVLLSVTNTLQNLDVAFDLSTNDDITIENELSSMSPEQRANQAMNLLLYNTYTGPGTKASANLSGNPLFSFLESQVNSWAANNIKGVDISFGIDQYDKTTDGSTSTTTSYSYQVSKSLFNDRFKIVIGGNYSTDADADENFSENLINDISFEYMLNRSGSMYVRLFRHVGYESILEGEVTQTGVGFVLKRKLNSLRDIFRFAPASRSKDTTVEQEDKKK
ncbi:MAG: translocation/assembly module TamB [Bacteroides sp.]|nr:translocation/assembly module TamB [Bacteroides sp.]MCM1413228.1 translocation/assembly module TamB [Bacteroides sp.]MCM1471462.1 translocation/assembly module TamB [Bacteroides sp.]